MVWEFGDLGRIVKMACVCSGCRSGAVNKHVGLFRGLDHQTHYWALRQQARSSLAPVWGGRRVVALLWWWGVVFDLWIVVASI